MHRMKPLLLLSLIVFLSACTQESQNQIGRSIQNWTGVNDILEIYAGEKLVKRFIQVDKLTTATATDGTSPRPYRFGYGILDENLDGENQPLKSGCTSSSATTPRATSFTKVHGPESCWG